MISEDIGVYYNETQKQIQSLKGTLDIVKKQGGSNPDDKEYNNLCSGLEKEIETVNNNVEKRLDDLFYNMINNYSHTLLELKSKGQEDMNFGNTQGSSNIQFGGSTMSTQKKKRNYSSQLARPSSKIERRQKNDNILQDLSSQDPRTKPLGENQYKAKYNTQRKKQQSEKIIKRDLRSQKIQDPDLGEAKVTENQMQQQGLLSLINKGKIPRGSTITNSLLGPDNNLFTQRPIKLIESHQKSIKRQINEENKNINTLNYKLESQIVKQSGSCVVLPHINSHQNKRFQQNNSQQKNLENLKQTDQKFKKYQNIKSSSNSQRQNENLDLKLKQVEQKSYADVVDSYSVYHFYIRKGEVLSDTPEFLSYKKVYKSKWNQINIILKSMEKLMFDSNIKLATVDGKLLADLSNKDTPPTVEDLVRCLVNKKEVAKIIKLPKIIYEDSEEGEFLAASKIQATWKMFRAVREYNRLKILIQKVRIIQHFFTLMLYKKRTKRQVRDKNQESLQQFEILQRKLKEDWLYMKYQKRVEIHINTFSFDELKRLTMEKVSQRQNIQITRIFALKDPLVDVIYVSPYDLSQEIINYYYKILELNGFTDFKDRLHFVWPQNYQSFPAHTPTSKLLLYSPKSMKRIGNLVKNKYSYIVPGYPSNDDIKLAVELNIPIYSSNPQQHLQLSTKSGCRRIFQASQIPTPPGAYEIYDEKEFYNTLSILITNNLKIDTWLLKIDDETLGRGIAYFSIDSIPYLKQLRKKEQLEVNQQFLQEITEVLKEKLPKKVKMACKSLYINFQEFMQNFCRKGGIIEASPTCTNSQISSPSIFFEIDPLGNSQVLASYDKIQGTEYRNIASVFPQTSLPSMNLDLLTNTIAEQLYSKGIIGYITLDLIAFPDPINNENHPLFWAIGLDCFMNNYSSACNYFYYLVKGKCDPITGTCILTPEANDVQNQNKLQQNFDENPNNITNMSGISNNQIGSTNKLNISRTSSISSSKKLFNKYSQQLNSNKPAFENLENQQRSFIYIPQIQHPGLESLQYKTFFHLCRVESISFDLERKIGSTFVLMDSLQSGILGIMAIGQTPVIALKHMNESFKFLMRHLGQSQEKFNKTDINESRTDKIYISDIQSKLKLILRQFEKDNSINKNKSLSNVSEHHNL